jgi:hypothetical protein
MRKFIENIFLAGAFLTMLQSARGFSLAGPVGNADDAWQTITIDYGFNDPVAPKDIYEEYRPVVPVMYYACDASFLSYYGDTGLTNVDAAFGILNGALCGLTNTPVFLYTPTNGVTLPGNGQPGGVPVTLTAANTVDRYSADLSEFPLENQQQNYTAGTLGLMDIKSYVLHDVVLELGLADSPRYVWTLHDRLPNPAVKNPICPTDEEYLVVQRNYDVNPTQNYPYSSYINGTLYYLKKIEENCGDPNAGVPWMAATEPVSADGAGGAFPPVTAGGLVEGDLNVGSYYTSLTRDDAAGFRYLLSSNNVNWEATAPSGGQLFTITTNSSAPQVFPAGSGAGTNATGTNAIGFYYYDGTYGYGDLAAFLSFARTNNQATLQAAYPGVDVSGVDTSWVEATNVTYVYEPAPVGSEYGSPPKLVPVYTPYYQFIYNYAFANVFTNHYSTNGIALMQTVSANSQIGSPYGSGTLTTNTVKLKNQTSGDFFVLPPFYDKVCPLDIVSTGIHTVVATTNLLNTATTNILNTTSTNSVGTNYTSLVYSVTYFTNYQYVIDPVTCSQSATNTPALRRGVGRVAFIRANYDSLMGQFFEPLTNYYSMVKIVGSQPVTEYYERVVTTPDFLFQAQDLTVTTPPYFPYGYAATYTTPKFDTSAITTQLAGPGTIVPGTTIVFNKNENLLYWAQSLGYFNIPTNQFLNSTNLAQMDGWGSFDGSTNYPVYYPDSAGIANLMNQIVIQAAPAPASLNGTNGQPYSVTFTVSGGQPPYTLAAPGLSVPGLGFVQGSPTSGTLSGTPTVTTTFNFTLQVTDSANRVVSLNYPITIH